MVTNTPIPLSPKETVLYMIDRYNKEVKPAIETGQYELASVALGSVAATLTLDAQSAERVIGSVHYGAGFIVACNRLETILRTTQDPTRIRLGREYLEMCIAQTGLPKDNY